MLTPRGKLQPEGPPQHFVRRSQRPLNPALLVRVGLAAYEYPDGRLRLQNIPRDLLAVDVEMPEVRATAVRGFAPVTIGRRIRDGDVDAVLDAMHLHQLTMHFAHHDIRRLVCVPLRVALLGR